LTTENAQGRQATSRPTPSRLRGGRVYDGTDYDIIAFNRPGPRIVKALREIAAVLHPDLFRER